MFGNVRTFLYTENSLFPKKYLLVSDYEREYPISLNVSILTTCSVIHDTVEKSRNKHKVPNIRTAVVSTGKRTVAADFYCGKVNPLTPELNPSAQSCLPRFLLGILIFKSVHCATSL
jgi:hypothetical protein